MDCIKDYIGINWCKAEVPESNLYINDLPGLSLKSIDSIANEEQVTFLEVWNQVQKRAIQILNTAVVSEFSRRYKLCRVSELFDIGKKINSDTNQTPAANEARGFLLELNSAASMLQVIHVQEISLALKNDSDFEIRLYDLPANLELGVYQVSGVTGWNRISINRDFPGVTKLAVTFDGPTSDSPELLLDENLSADCCTACVQLTTCAASLRGIHAHSAETVEYGNNTFGLSGIFSIQCSYEQLVCANKSLFATALWYLLGAEMLTERIHSDRLNRYTTIDLKKALELRDEFYAQYKTELAAAIEGINLNTADCCLECNQPLTLQTNLP